MTEPTGPTQGFIAVSWAGTPDGAPDLRAVLAAISADAPALTRHGSILAATWGLDVQGFDGSQPLLLCRSARRREHELDLDDVRRLLAGPSRDGLEEVLPTFAAVDHLDEDTILAAVDALGFRHLYYGQREDFAVLSTSARAVGACLGNDLDREAIALQSLLGWQVGQRTLFDGVQKLAPGELATLSGGRISISSSRRPLERFNGGLDASVAEAANVLRRYLSAFLDDHPDATLQLTGGQDSRLLLSAVPPARRRGLRSLTLGLPGNPDCTIAGDLSRRYGLTHEVLRLDGLEALAPEEASLRCVQAARRLECMADPLAHAALTFAEAEAKPGARIGGLGGEVARGFYYLGPVTTAPVTRKRVERLTRWRMFANESVAADALDPAFVSWAREFAVDEVFALSAGTGRDWMAATDDFYLDQRMQRWAGVTDTAVCFDRVISNPMLDDRFIAIARGLHPRDKRNSRFLSRLQIALDDQLARIPLDGRPAPVAYANRSLGNSARQIASTVGKAARKARQRAVRANRPPAGGEILAAKVVEHWRANPALLDPLRAVGIFREPWIDQALAGEVDPDPSAVALMTNMCVAAESLPRSTPEGNGRPPLGAVLRCEPAGEPWAKQ
jgi:asparagine synthase (glutamine-hydrolysing)